MKTSTIASSRFATLSPWFLLNLTLVSLVGIRPSVGAGVDRWISYDASDINADQTPNDGRGFLLAPRSVGQ
ncbi:MAG TPA: hypothetical protein PLX89_00050 [Verrucomicrobiota bacterium]|nr:hypothetical protein [Verrucomicrobiales bacterium]HRI11368.1 hypothetical protein [Verrucomicrobiota bacterium]